MKMMRLATLAALGLAVAGAIGATEPMPGPFLVFFDWGKPEVRSDDGTTLDRVADVYRANAGAHIRLTGHTDRSGNAAVNRAAGLKRAATVRAELEKRGIPRNAMRIASFGEERPLVPTEDGVREVQNRRVEIVLEE
jgi:outer membrane protein OmpA-like peptidoglycan-associated protein